MFLFSAGLMSAGRHRGRRGRGRARIDHRGPPCDV